MTKLFSDTHPQIEELQIRLWRRASPAYKLRSFAQLNAFSAMPFQ
ncbi:MAG: hypothetical protein N3D16_09605 [Anaerolineales bacterium]|nr:hypothetical protein [Anaerolineales bacterium]